MDGTTPHAIARPDDAGLIPFDDRRDTASGGAVAMATGVGNVGRMPFDDEPDDAFGFQPPLPPDDRLWRHPSELGPAGAAAPIHVVTRPQTNARLWLVALSSVLVGVVGTVGVLAATGVFDTRTNRSAVEQVQLAMPKNPGDSDLAIADKVMPAVARVEATGPAGPTAGSAVVFRTDGHLLTSADAVDGADSITVLFNDGRQVPAQLVGTDPSSDVAVVKVGIDDLPTAVLGHADSLQLGEPTIAIATSTAKPEAPSIAVGLVSALGRRVDSNAGALHDMIQTNVRLDADATGATLLDKSGAVVGLVTTRGARAADTKQTKANTVTTTAATSAATVYATPIDYAKSVADDLIATGHAVHVWMGVEGADLSDGDTTRLGRAGARLTAVAADGPAAAAGLRDGDIVVAVDAQPIGSMSAMVVALRRHRPGDSVAISYVRGDEQQVTLVSLAEKPAHP